MADQAHLGGMELVDQTLDTSIVAIRAQQQQEHYQKKLNELVDGNAAGSGGGAGLAAPDGVASEDPNDADQERDPFKDTRIIYNSLHRGACYHAFAWMWCGCFEPKYKITASYAIGEEWESCCLRVCSSLCLCTQYRTQYLSVYGIHTQITLNYITLQVLDSMVYEMMMYKGNKGVVGVFCQHVHVNLVSQIWQILYC